MWHTVGRLGASRLSGSLLVAVLVAGCAADDSASGSDDVDVVELGDADLAGDLDDLDLPGPDRPDTSEAGADVATDAASDGSGGPGGVMARSPDGRFGSADVTVTLPTPDEGNGLWVPDVQEAFADVDWSTVDRLYIPAGHYPFIRIGNLPERSLDDPLVITNHGGQVRVGALDHYYLFSLGGGSGWVLSGRYDPISETGHPDFAGHRYDVYAHRAGTYGILIDDELVRDSISGLGVGNGATDFEIEFVEVRNVGFAGMTIKTDDDGAATMANVWIHDNYIHDTVSEGMYIGSTQAQPQHVITGFEISYNRVLRTGTEAIQLGQLAGDNDVHHNVFGPAAIDWRDAFQNFQDGNLQIAVRSGVTTVHHNVFLGAAGSMVGLFGAAVEGDVHVEGDGVVLQDNYFAHFRNLAVYANVRDVSPLTFTLRDNVFRGYHFDRDEVYTDATPPGHLIRQGNGSTPIAVYDNRFDDHERLCNGLPDECNGENGLFVGSGNAAAEVAPIAFVDAGLEPGFDYLELEMWTDVASRNGNAPVSYDRTTIVMYRGDPYECLLDPCPAGVVPEGSPATWEPLPAFADDVRVMSEAYDHIGLSDG